MTRYEIKKIGDYRIELEGFNNTFQVSELDKETKNYNDLKSFPKISDAEDYIENREKRLLAKEVDKKEPLLILQRSRWGDKFEEAKITSLDGNNAWIVTIKDKRMSKDYKLTFEQLQEHHLVGGFPLDSENGQMFKQWQYLGSFSIELLEALIKEAKKDKKSQDRILIFQTNNFLAPAAILREKDVIYLAPRHDERDNPTVDLASKTTSFGFKWLETENED